MLMPNFGAIRVSGIFIGAASIVLVAALAQTDPGIRSGPADAGGPLSGLTSSQQAFFNQGQDTFEEIDPVSEGLGPRYNADSCGACHAFPAVGGSSPALNPQIAVATKMGAHNTVPSFITSKQAVMCTCSAPIWAIAGL